MTTVVLASASPARLAVLRAAGLDPEVIVSGVDEDDVLARYAHLPCADRVGVLADLKARAVAARAPLSELTIVIGCDSMLEIDGELLGKPHTPTAARGRWRAMSGATGVLHTGHAVYLLPLGDGWTTFVSSSSTVVHFAEVTDAEIDAYVGTGEPLEVAGAFTLDGYGGWFVDSIDGDPSNVLGISLPLLRRMFAELGVAVTDLWRAPT